jgi:hypothetical protein
MSDDDDEMQALRAARRNALGEQGAERLEALRRRAAAAAASRNEDYFADAPRNDARDAPEPTIGPPRPSTAVDVDDDEEVRCPTLFLQRK